MSQEKLVHVTPNPAVELYGAWRAMLGTVNTNSLMKGNNERTTPVTLEELTSGSNPRTYSGRFTNEARGIQVENSRAINIAGFTKDTSEPIFSFGYGRMGRVRWPLMLLAPTGEFWISSWSNWGDMNALDTWTFFGTTWVYRRRVMFVPHNITEMNDPTRPHRRYVLDFRDWEERRMYFYPPNAPYRIWWELALRDDKWVAIASLNHNSDEPISDLRDWRVIHPEGALYGEAVRKYDRERRRDLKAQGKDPNQQIDEGTVTQVSQVIDIYQPANKNNIEVRPKEAQHG